MIILNNIDSIVSSITGTESSSRFWIIYSESKDKPEMLYDTKELRLWQVARNHSPLKRGEAEEYFEKLDILGINQWNAASQDELLAFVKAITPSRFISLYKQQSETFFFAKTEHMVKITPSGVSKSNCGSGGTSWLLGYSSSLSDSLNGSKKLSEFITLSFLRGWKLAPLFSTDAEEINTIHDVLKHLDHFSSRLPKFDTAQLTDQDKGIWELWGSDVPHHFNVRQRNPVADIQNGHVAIDFGTSSTVVAMEEHGRKKLLRVGVKDFWAKEQAKDYENPTVLEMINLKSVLKAWQKVAYRPFVSWNDVRCSHEALHNLRHNEASPKVVSSVLSKIKHWALREANGSQVRITDQEKGLEHTLEPLTLRQTVKGQPIEVSEDDPFDPLELYAWFLGLNINWRGRGIFLKYYMSFPVAYPKEVKEKILASFRRGLQRSLPHTLVPQPEFREFTVEERATEPAAYAAAAMEELDIEPTEEGLPYAVFDFGGGTADFDYGYYRLPDEDEEDEGYEQVFEHVGAAGDQFLGGENLLENMAYRVFLENLEVCRENKIAFTRPLDASDFAGSEMFLEKTQAAATNTIMLMARLRPIWETGENENTTGVEVIELLNRNGEKVRCELSIDTDELLGYLEQRIEQGIQNFYVAMHKAFGNKKPELVKVLLAGNSSRSSLVLDFFGLSSDETDTASTSFDAVAQLMIRAGNSTAEESQESRDNQTASNRHIRMQQYLSQLFNDNVPQIIAHKPLAADEKDVYKPTAKTGVALGLLNLCPGSETKVINNSLEQSEDNAPFAYYVGRSQRKKFKAGLKQGDAYNEFVQLGPIRERVFHLYYSHSPKANTGEMPVGDNELYAKRLDFAGNTDGHKVFAKAVSPSEIEICTAASLEAIATNESDNQQLITLK